MFLQKLMIVKELGSPDPNQDSTARQLLEVESQTASELLVPTMEVPMDELHIAAAEVAERILATTASDEKRYEDSRVFQDLQQMALVILRQIHVN